MVVQERRGFTVTDMAISPSSNRAHVALSLRKNHDAEPRQLLHFLLSGISYIKHAVVVDDDVNVRDPEDVEWAMATRFQGDEDLVIIPQLKARGIDPSKKEGRFMTKVGLDATAPLALRERFKRISVPPEVREKVAGAIPRLLGQYSKAK
jgi:2,5-furandicarboxylate decarboxylase 1